MHSPTLPTPYTTTTTPSPPFITAKTMNNSTFTIRSCNLPKFHLHRANSVSCKSSNCSSYYSSIADSFNLCDLLGVDSSSDQSQLKVAYRALQKRCHPDIAGPAGHDMSIILNQAYALLSDPFSRLAYDKELAKYEDLHGYKGKPIYSSWFGCESENRAVFVDEVRCIGCLKCAVLAGNTFAVESVYGRARVVAQWADPEHKIQESIDSCPVDCISMVKRSDLAALEFLMSKKPRGSVRIGTGNTVGVRTSDVFQDLDKFQARYRDALKKRSASSDAKKSDNLYAAAAAAIQAIRNISSTDWLYWKAPISFSGDRAKMHQGVMLISENSTEAASFQKLITAASAAKKRANQKAYICNEEEYWVPSSLLLPKSVGRNQSDEIIATTTSTVTELKEQNEIRYEEIFSGKDNGIQRNPSILLQSVPMAIATLVIVHLHLGEATTTTGDVLLRDHIGGSLALDIVNSSWLQVVLAGLTWYLLGMAAMELLVAVHHQVAKFRK